LSAHGVGGAEKENLHLMVIEPCRKVADVTSGLIMKIAAVVARVGGEIGLSGNIVPAVPPPSVDDAGQVSEVEASVSQPVQWSCRQVIGETINAGADVCEVTLHQLTDIVEEVEERRRANCRPRRQPLEIVAEQAKRSRNVARSPLLGR
jgi:hypothetical protein